MFFKKKSASKDRLTRAMLESTPDSKLVLTIIDDIDGQITDYSKVFETVSKMSIGQRAIYATWIVEEEVNNGGFNQFYYNSSRKFAAFAEEAFELLGAHELAKLMIEANKKYMAIHNELSKKLDGTLKSFSKSYEDNPLNQFDQKLYDLVKKEELYKLQEKYIRSHITEFIID